MATRVHEVKFPGDAFWTVLTDYVQAKSMQLDELLMNDDYRACKDVYRFTIAGYTSAIHDEFYSADEVIQFRCTESGTTLFTGKIDPNYRQRIGQLLGPLVLEAEDNSYLLDEPVQTSLAYPALVGGAAYKIFDSGDTANSLVHQLLTAAGYNIATDIAGAPDTPDDITTTITHVSASADEGTYWELIDDILHFHGYVMRWTADGKYTHENWAPAVVTSSHTFKDDIATNPALVMNKKFVDFDGVEVEWCTLGTRSNARLYQMSLPFNSDGTFAGESIAAGSEYPLGADTDDTYQDYREKWLDLPSQQVVAAAYSSTVAVGRTRKRPGIKAIDLIASSGHSIKDNYEAGITRTLTYESLRAKLYYSNPTGSTLKLWYSYIYGDALFRAMIRKTKSLFVAGATRLAQIQTRHLYNETVATKYAIARRNALQYGDFTYSFSSKTSVYVGSIATIQYTDPVTSIAFDTEVVVVGKKKSKHLPLYHYQAFGVTAYSVEAVDTEGEEVTNLVYEGIRDAARATNLLPDASAYSDYDPIPQSDCEYWDLRQPDCKSHLNRSPESGYLVSFFPGHLYDELKTEYDNAWAKFTGLGTIGVFKATTNLVSDPEDLTDSAVWPIGGTPTRVLSDKYFKGRRFTKITGGGASDNIRCSAITFGSTGVKSFSVVVKKCDAAAVPRVGLYNPTDGYDPHLEIDWSAKTVTIVVGSGAIVKANWYGDDIVEILCQTDSLTATTPNYLYLRPDEDSTNSTYFTAVQVEDSTYPTPYTPTERAAGDLGYSFDLQDEGSIECWVRMWATHDRTAAGFVWCIGDTYDASLSLRYDNTDDKFEVRIRIDGSNYRTVQNDSAYATDASVWTWIHVKVSWDISAQSIRLWINGTEHTDTTSAGTVTAFAPASDDLFIGNRDGSILFDGLITDFLYKNYVDTSTGHYTSGEPYYDPDEMANQYQSVRINKTGIRMHNAGLTIVDGLNRLISISNADGMLARDAGGQIIHDIPNAPIQVGNWYCGHDLWNDDLSSYKVYDSTAFTVDTWIDVTCLTNANANIKKGIFKVYVRGAGTAVAQTWCYIFLRPKGSAWGATLSSNTPADYVVHYFNANVCTFVGRIAYLECPIGDDNKIQFYAAAIPINSSKKLVVTQLGLGI